MRSVRYRMRRGGPVTAGGKSRTGAGAALAGANTRKTTIGAAAGIGAFQNGFSRLWVVVTQCATHSAAESSSCWWQGSLAAALAFRIAWAAEGSPSRHAASASVTCANRNPASAKLARVLSDLRPKIERILE